MVLKHDRLKCWSVIIPNFHPNYLHCFSSNVNRSIVFSDLKRIISQSGSL